MVVSSFAATVGVPVLGSEDGGSGSTCTTFVVAVVGEVVLGESPTVAADGTYVSSPASEAEAEGF